MSNIEWTEKTWNPVVGCSRVSEGCRNCYAEVMARRLAAMAIKDGGKGRKANYLNVVKHDAMGTPLPQWNGKIKLVHEALGDPLRWVKPRMIFVNSMSDLFHEGVPFDFIDKVFAVMALCPQHTFQILTKRPERMAEYINRITEQQTKDNRGTIFETDIEYEISKPGGILSMVDFWNRGWRAVPVYNMEYGHQCATEYEWVDDDQSKVISWPLPNVWLGTSTENQSTYDQRHPFIDKLTTAGWTTFLSMEPLLGQIEMAEDSPYCEWCGPAYTRFKCDNGQGGTEEFCADCASDNPDGMTTVMWGGLGVSWVIVGAESGHGARACDIEWVREIVEFCQDHNVPVFVKQLINNGRKIPFNQWPEDLRVRQMPKIRGAA